MPRHERKTASRPNRPRPTHTSDRQTNQWLSALPLATRIRLQRLKPSTQTQYRIAFCHFAQWLEDEHQPDAHDAATLDRQLERFGLYIFGTAAGRRQQTVAAARLACIWLNPTLKGQLPLSLGLANPTAWYAAAGRTRQSHRPITWPLVCLIAHRFAAEGRDAAAVAVVVGFDAMLRISEAAGLRVGDVAEVAGVDARLPDGVMLSIRSAKTLDEA
jgi:hypothetical protein